MSKKNVLVTDKSDDLGGQTKSCLSQEKQTYILCSRCLFVRRPKFMPFLFNIFLTLCVAFFRLQNDALQTAIIELSGHFDWSW